MAQTRRLRVAPTAAGAAVNRGGRWSVRCGTAWLAGGAGTRQGPVAAARVRAGVRASGRITTGR
jgi:hypothetical protein